MIAKRTIPVIAIAVALFGFIWFVERQAPTTDEARDKAKRALDIDPDKATRVEVAGSDGAPVYVLAKKGASWSLELPRKLDADAATASAVVTDVCRIEIEGILPKPVDRKAYGLEPAERTVVVVADGMRNVIRIGHEVPGFEAVALEIEGSDVAYAAKRAVDRAARKSLDELRDRDLFRKLVDQATRIEIAPPGEAPFSLEKKGREWWVRFDGVPDDLADAEKIARFTAGLRGLRVQAFGGPPPDPPLSWGFSVHGAGGVSRRVDVEFPGTISGPPDGQVRLGFDGETASAPARLRDDLPGDARSLAPMGQWDVAVSKLTLRRGGEHREFARDAAGSWSSGGQPAANRDNLDEVVRILGRGLGNRIVPMAEATPKDFRSLEPAFQVEIQGEDGTRYLLDVIRGNGAWGVWDKRRPMIVLFDDERFEPLRRSLEALLKPAVPAASAAPSPQFPPRG